MRVDNAITHIVPSVLLASSGDHGDVPLNVVAAGIEAFSIHLPRHFGVLTDLVVGGRVGVDLGPSLRVVDDLGILILAYVGASKGFESADWRAMCRLLCEKKKVGWLESILSCASENKNWMRLTYLAL